MPQPLASPEHRLYERLAAEEGDAAHSRYNALVRRLVSFERAADARSAAAGQPSSSSAPSSPDALRGEPPSR